MTTLADRLAIGRFTNLGYLWNARRFSDDLQRMEGKTVVVTGGSGGLGLAAAESLASLGARVVIVGRNQGKLDAAVATIGGEPRGVRCDLSLLREIRALAAHLTDTEPHIDVLINNVGVLLPERRVSDEGLEMTLATNLAGHFLLTNLLLPRLIESAPARVVNVTSGGMYSARIRPDDLQFRLRDYTGTAAYAHTKRGQVILSEMWAAALAETGVVVHVLHPGWARTSGVKQSLPTFDRLMRPLLRTPEQGADTIVWLAAAADPMRSTGRFWFDRRPAPTHLTDRTVENAGDRQQLWDALVELTGSDFALAGNP